METAFPALTLLQDTPLVEDPTAVGATPTLTIRTVLLVRDVLISEMTHSTVGMHTILTNAQLDGFVIQSTTNVFSESQERDTLFNPLVLLSAKEIVQILKDGDAISHPTNVKNVPKMILPAPPKEVLLVETVNLTHLKNSNVIKPIHRIQNVPNVMKRNQAAKNILKLAKHALNQPKNKCAITKP